MVASISVTRWHAARRAHWLTPTAGKAQPVRSRCARCRICAVNSDHSRPSTTAAQANGLTSVGVTGTNGKTSCSQWIAQVLTREGRRCAVIGTVGIGFPGALEASDLTTPDPVSLQREVRRLLDAGAQALAMEVSSIGLAQGRVEGMHFDVALFTNLTRDHLDFHQTMQQYEAAKSVLFGWPGLRPRRDQSRRRGGLSLCRAGARPRS